MKTAYLAGFVGFLILALAIGNHPIGQAFFIVSLASGLGALILWVAGFRKSDRYDLKLLEKVDRDERRRQIEDELEQIDSAGNAVCLTCGTHFDPEFSRCPRCGRSIYQ